MTRQCRILALIALGAMLPLVAQAAGTGTMSHTIGCSGSTLTYSVTNGPANTCGDLYTIRNGSLITAGGWLCTDPTGSGSNGPWTWANTPADQYDTEVRIVWPDGSETTRSWHVWDKTCPTVNITSPTGTPPTSFSGTAADTTYGSGFRSNCLDSNWTSMSQVYALYKDVTTPSAIKYWSPSTGTYSSSTLTISNYVYGTITGMPSQNVNWSVSVPTAAAHFPGRSYEWQVCVSDCCCTSCAYRNF